jgi:hypothetical protein
MEQCPIEPVGPYSVKLIPCKRRTRNSITGATNLYASSDAMLTGGFDEALSSLRYLAGRNSRRVWSWRSGVGEPIYPERVWQPKVS